MQENIVYSLHLNDEINDADDIAISQFVDMYQFKIVEGLAQGDCFYDTIIQFIRRYQDQPPLSHVLLSLPEGSKNLQIAYLREILVSYMEEHVYENKYMNQFDQEQRNTINQLRKLKVYSCPAGDLVLYFASNAYGINIQCYNLIENDRNQRIDIQKLSFLSDHPDNCPTIHMLRTYDHFRLLWPSTMPHKRLVKESTKKNNVNYESNNNKTNMMLKRENNQAKLNKKMNNYTQKVFKKYGNNYNSALHNIELERIKQENALNKKYGKRMENITKKSKARNNAANKLYASAKAAAASAKAAAASAKVANVTKEPVVNNETTKLIAKLSLQNKKPATTKKKTLENLQQNLEDAYQERNKVEQTKRVSKVWSTNDEDAFQRQIRNIDRVIVRIGERIEKRLSGGKRNQTKKNKK